MILSEKIMSLRKQNGWSQENLADQLDVSRQSVSKWESGTSIPDIEKIVKMSELFNVSTDYLLGRTDLKRYVIPDERFQTFAAHIDDDATEEEIEEILAFIEFKKNLKKNK